MKCRHCGETLKLPLIDLGSSPPSNAYLTAQTLHKPEKWFPLRVLVCEACWLVQTEDYANAEELFDAEYAYFSSYSQSWLQHAEKYVHSMVEKFELGSSSLVMEVAANDGYLLQYFQKRNIPCLGIEPTQSTALVARSKGLEIVEEFFGERLAQQLAKAGKMADLTTANNVLAHVPDINDFVTGFANILKPYGVSTFEFPHLLQLVEQSQFDTIYHEHFSYLSLTSVMRIFEANGLSIFDVEELATHGGSLRVYAQLSHTKPYPVSESVSRVLKRESDAGIAKKEFYQGLEARALKIKHELLNFLLQANKDGLKVMAYGAAAKGNTLLNYAGIRGDLISSVVDKNPNKQGKFLPGSRIPIVDENQLHAIKPGYVVILPWNLRDEVLEQLSYIKEWGGRFVIPIPSLEVL